MFARICVWFLCLACVCSAQIHLAGKPYLPTERSEAPSFYMIEDSHVDCVLVLVQGMDRGSHKVGLLLDLAGVYQRIGQKDKALEMLPHALQMINVEQEQTLAEIFLKTDRDRLLARIAEVYAKAGSHDQAMQLLNTIDKPLARVRGLTNIAIESFRNGQKERASELLSLALNAIESTPDKDYYLGDMAIAYAEARQYDQALKLARTISKKWVHFRAKTLATIASEYAKAGQKDKAPNVLIEALQATKAIPPRNHDIKPGVLADISRAYIDAGQRDKALKILPQALQLARAVKINNVELKDVAVAYAKAGQYKQALRVAKAIDYKPSQLDALIDMAREYTEAGQKNMALETLTQALLVTKEDEDEDEDDEDKVETLVKIAVEYTRAGRRDKASELLIQSLQLTKTLDDYDKLGVIVKIAEAYANAGLKVDAEAKKILQEICENYGKPPTLTPEEQHKLRRAEEAADRFIQRWHETLDMDVLFDEMYVSNPEQRRRNVNLFYGVYKQLSATAYDPGITKGVDEAIMRKGFMAFWNLFYLTEEYRLAFQDPEDQEQNIPPEIAEAFNDLRKIKLNEKYIILAEVKAYIAKANHTSSLLRKYLTREAFDSPLYRANLSRCREGQPAALSFQRMLNSMTNSKDKSRFSISRGFREFGVRKEIEVYELNHCLFAFYFVEEAGQLKVLTLGFEL